MTPLITVGHGTLEPAELAALLTSANVRCVIDVRRFPGSRRHPGLALDALAISLPEAGVAYQWEQRLGGRRHLTKDQDAAAPDQWWRVAAFRAYAGYTRTPEFAAGVDVVLGRMDAPDAGRPGPSGPKDRSLPADGALAPDETLAPGEPRAPDGALTLDETLAPDVSALPGGLVAVMCSESVWWRCHRRLIADVVTLTRGAEVRHLMHDGRLHLHEPSAGARLATPREVVWDGTD